ncbi:MAG: hypothetical protein FGM62_00945 [Methylobacterium sp.]|nr:hypothetical protein [Methylobacterium sp.]
MDNKYGLGSARVATAQHDAKPRPANTVTMDCRFCGGSNLILCTTMNDHYCKDCGEYQADVPHGYSTGHSADY